MINIKLKRSIFLLMMVCNTAYAQSDFSLITSRIKTQQIEGSNEKSVLKNVVSFLPAIREDGSWADIDYSDRGITKWKPGIHLERIKNLALVYINKGGIYYNSSIVWNAINSGLRFWYAKYPKSDNWWHNEIATPKILGEIMILLQNSKPQFPPGLQDSLVHRMTQGNVFEKTGANKLDIAIHMIYRACITKDKSLMDTAAQQAFQPIVLTTGEGLQYDNSYMQHGAQLQISSYGLVFLSGEYKVANWMQGTSYALRGEKLDLLGSYLVNTFLTSIRGRYIDFNTEGRGISRPDILDKRSLSQNKNEDGLLGVAKKVDPKNEVSIDAAIARISEKQPADYKIVPLHHQFWIGDYTQHLRPAYSFNVRMVSDRSKRTESGNKEDLLGKFLADGATDIQRSGGEYFNIMPIWDWNKIPGTTNRDFNTDQPITVQWGENGSTSFVGGVSDGVYGASAYDMDYDDVKAKKSCFFFDKEVVSLGAGIDSKASENIVTTINQCWLKGKVVASENGNISTIKDEIKSSGFNWVWHDSIGYFFPEKENINITNQIQTGNWKRINASYSKDEIQGAVFKMWIDHGAHATNGNYSYITVPGISADAMKDYHQNELIILSNTDRIQAVEHTGLKMIQAVFYQPGTLTSKDVSITVDKPCILLLNNSNKGMSVSIADPTHKITEVSVNIKSKSKNIEKKLVCHLPDGHQAGSSAHFSVKF